MKKQYAGLFRRVGGSIIDIIILTVVIFCMYTIFGFVVEFFHSPEMSAEVHKNTATLQHFVTNNVSTLNQMGSGPVSDTAYPITLDTLSVLFGILVLIIPPIYYISYWKTRNATIGEKWLDLKVTYENGDTDMSVFRLFIRWLVYLCASILYPLIILNFLLVIFASKRQLLQDALCGTIVVVKE